VIARRTLLGGLAATATASHAAAQQREKPDQSSLPVPPGYVATECTFVEDWAGNALSPFWHDYITSNAANGWPWNYDGKTGSGMGNQKNAEYYVPTQLAVKNGMLEITEIKQPINGIAQGAPFTFLCTSGVICSYGRMEFRGGQLQISMKQSSGSGVWNSLWMMVGSHAGAGYGDRWEIDIQEGGFLDGLPVESAPRNLAWHLYSQGTWRGGIVDGKVNLSDDFHTYGIDWDPGQHVSWYFDGNETARLTRSQCPIPDVPMHVIISHQMGNASTSGWHTTLSDATPQEMVMQVKRLELYQHSGSGLWLHPDAAASRGRKPSEPMSKRQPTIQKKIK